MDIARESPPLSEADLDRLEQLLESDIFQGQAMLLDELQGFLCAVCSGPDLVPPSEWLPIVVGEGFRELADEQVTEFLDLTVRFYNQIALQLSEGQAPELILYAAEEGDEGYDYAPWADGYLLGSDLGPRPWLDAAGDHGEELAELLEPFFVINRSLKEDERGTDRSWSTGNGGSRTLRTATDQLPRLVIAIFDFWRAKTATPETFVRDSEKVGRNDACPCGSGRKFKACCGDPKRLH